MKVLLIIFCASAATYGNAQLVSTNDHSTDDLNPRYFVGSVNETSKKEQNDFSNHQSSYDSRVSSRSEGGRSLNHFGGQSTGDYLSSGQQPSRSYLPTATRQPSQHLGSSNEFRGYSNQQSSTGYHSKFASSSQNQYSQNAFQNKGFQSSIDSQSRYGQSNDQNQLYSQQHNNPYQQPFNNPYNLDSSSATFSTNKNQYAKDYISYNSNNFDAKRSQYQGNHLQGDIRGHDSRARGFNSDFLNRPSLEFNRHTYHLQGQNASNNLAEYDFGYGVAVEETGAEFEHEESRRGDQAKGIYKVLLPDGRRQLVEYEADGYGFRPKISYEGRSFRDPLTQHNLNTVVTDLLNTDLKRTRDQADLSRQQYFTNRNLNYQDDRSHSPGPFGRGIHVGQQNYQGRQDSSLFSSNSPQIYSSRDAYQRSLNTDSNTRFNQVPEAEKRFISGSYSSNSGLSYNVDNNRYAQSGARHYAFIHHSPSLHSQSSQQSASGILQNDGTSSSSTPYSRGTFGQNNFPTTYSPSFEQSTDKNKFPLKEEASLISGKFGLRGQNNPTSFNHSPGILYSQSYANSRPSTSETSPFLAQATDSPKRYPQPVTQPIVS